MGPVRPVTGPEKSGPGLGFAQEAGVLQDFHGQVKGFFPAHGTFEKAVLPVYL